MRLPALTAWGALAIAGAGTALLGAGRARADRLDVAAEARVNGSFQAASSMLLGTPDGTGPCGLQQSVDGGADVSGTVVGALYGRSYRYQVAASLGYYTLVCTPFLRRPVGGFDLRGEHALSDRTRLTASGHAIFDRFDRSNDARSGNTMDAGAMMASMMAATTTERGQAAGLPFMQGTFSLELQHGLSKRYGLRTGLTLRLLELLDTVARLPEFSTLGPMEAAELSVVGLRELTRGRIEVPIRYRVSHFYPGTLQELPPLDPKALPALALERGAVPPAHDLYLAGGYEHRISPRLVLHVEAGPALAVQPHLCTRLDPQLIPEGRCSIDPRILGIRGYDAPPPLEAQLGPLATLTLAGEASLSYARPRARFEVKVGRGYEPDPYAGALALLDRLALDYQWRPLWELTLSGNVQLLHSAYSSLGRVDDPPDRGAMKTQVVSPQDRTLYMALGNLGADWQLHRSVAVFVETSFQVFGIRGERVPLDPQSTIPGATQVPRFPTAPASTAMPPPATVLDVDAGYQQTERLTVLLGARVFFSTFPTPRREADLLIQARATP
ncbi:MAG: hypothetical protein U1A78_08465 [Polyangia bacterium]